MADDKPEPTLNKEAKRIVGYQKEVDLASLEIGVADAYVSAAKVPGTDDKAKHYKREASEFADGELAAMGAAIRQERDTAYLQREFGMSAGKANEYASVTNSIGQNITDEGSKVRFGDNATADGITKKLENAPDVWNEVLATGKGWTKQYGAFLDDAVVNSQLISGQTTPELARATVDNLAARLGIKDIKSSDLGMGDAAAMSKQLAQLARQNGLYK